MCGYLAPACVTTSDDLIEYNVKDSSTVDFNAKMGHSERFIHGEIFKMYPQVNCVVHSHAEAVLPYVTSGVPLMPVVHMAGFLGKDSRIYTSLTALIFPTGHDVPVFDIEPLYEPGERHDMLVRDMRMGSALASHFSIDPEFDPPALDYNVVLMRRHGYTTHGADIEMAVYRAIYTKINAGVQTNSTILRQAFNTTSTIKKKFAFEPLTTEQCDGCAIMNEGTQDKPWKLWVQEVEASNLYVNRG